MKKILCTFSGARYHDTTKKIVEDGPGFGADEVWVYDDIWLRTQKEHCAATKWAFDHPKNRGVNWFCFKPYTIIKTLERCKDGDLVLFTDADCWPIADMSPLFNMCERDGVVLFAACSHSQRHWCSRDCMHLMGMDSGVWRDKQAGVARFMLFQKDSHVITRIGLLSVDLFLKEWLDYTCDRHCNTFDNSTITEEYLDLKEHRCEQAILTNLAHKYGIPLHRECDQWGNEFKADFPNDTYGQIFESTGVYSYDPSGKRDGSSFRNVND